jgi:hypothetical protein
MAACKDSYGWICEGDCEEVKVKDRVMGAREVCVEFIFRQRGNYCMGHMITTVGGDCGRKPGDIIIKGELVLVVSTFWKSKTNKYLTVQQIFTFSMDSSRNKAEFGVGWTKCLYHGCGLNSNIFNN